MIGAIRQELLSGIQLDAQLALLRVHLGALPDLSPDAAGYEEAAGAFNRCRARDVQGSTTDFLICSSALRRQLAVYTTDKDFAQYATALPLALHKTRT